MQLQPADATEWPPPATMVARSPRQTPGRAGASLNPSRPPRPPSAGSYWSSEAYGFAGSIAAVAAALAYISWAYAPEPWLRSLGVAYSPSKYWAPAVPAIVMMAAALAVTAYMGSNLLTTPPAASLNTVLDKTWPVPSSCQMNMPGSPPRRLLMGREKRSRSSPSLTSALAR